MRQRIKGGGLVEFIGCFYQSFFFRYNVLKGKEQCGKGYRERWLGKLRGQFYQWFFRYKIQRVKNIEAKNKGRRFWRIHRMLLSMFLFRYYVLKGTL